MTVHNITSVCTHVRIYEEHQVLKDNSVKIPRRLLAATASLAAAATATLTGASVAHADTSPPHGKLIGSLVPDARQPQPPSALVEAPITSEKTCEPTAPGSRERAAGATKACVQDTPVQSSGAASKADAAPAARAKRSADTCTAKPGTWQFTRHTSCLNGKIVTFTLEGDKGGVLGTALIKVNNSATLDARGGTWNETETIKVAEVTGEVKSLNITFEAACDGLCTMTADRPWAGSKTLSLGQSATGTVTYKSTVAAQRRSHVSTRYNMYITQAGTVPTKPNVSWSNPRQIRCDAEMRDNTGNWGTGCVYSQADLRADLNLPLHEYGAAAATYLYAQTNLKDHWGVVDNPLRRNDDRRTAYENRQRTCGYKSSVPFVKYDEIIVKDDSCDEYPFAGTMEGGNDGGLCAEIVPLRDGVTGEWKTFNADDKRPVTGNEPCVRGHVPHDENSAAGGRYGNFVQDERVLNDEKFTVTITA
ncbi:NucA/NucB deoxyribonuclease domain-containing protein [Streptomyces sp. S186]|uniref:NucA/NucB deoxyribonuclease domain-containing protein n=1 Tax=Streptomyces sp. S186 TaxID=3434395 RepID=UPI003F6801B9